MMTDVSINDILNIEYPGAPEWSPGGVFIAATLSEANGNILLFVTANGETK